MTTTGATAGLSLVRPEDVAELFVRPMSEASVAMMVSTVLSTQANSMRLPIVTGDPTAGWYSEGADITPSDAATAEIDIVAAKVASLIKLSRELARDSSPAAATIVGQRASFDVARKVDEAFFTAAGGAAPLGLTGLTGGTAPNAITESGTAFTNIDKFIEATLDAERKGAPLAAFVTSKAEALALLQLKELASGSNKPLLGSDASQPTARSIAGIPLLVSPYPAVKTVWGIPRAASVVVIREDAMIEVSDQVFFASDQVAVKVTARIGFGFPYPAAIQKITHA